MVTSIKNICIKLKGVVGMPVPKRIQTSSRYHHIHVYGVSRPSLLIESIDSMQTILTFLILMKEETKNVVAKKELFKKVLTAWTIIGSWKSKQVINPPLMYIYQVSQS